MKYPIKEGPVPRPVFHKSELRSTLVGLQMGQYFEYDRRGPAGVYDAVKRAKKLGLIPPSYRVAVLRDRTTGKFNVHRVQ